LALCRYPNIIHTDLGRVYRKFRKLSGFRKECAAMRERLLWHAAVHGDSRADWPAPSRMAGF
jgi:hypothetical protein